MRRLFSLILVVNFILLLPKIKANLPNLVGYLEGDRLAGLPRTIYDVSDMFDWLKTQKERGLITEKTVVAYRRPHWCYYYTGIKSISFPYTYDEEKVLEALQQADLVVAENYDYVCKTYLNPTLLAYPQYFTPIFRTAGQYPNAVVFRIEKQVSR